MDAYRAELDEKVRILEGLLSNYNDGRRKSFYCLAVNLLELGDLNAVMARIAVEVEVDPRTPIKERAAAAVRLFNEAADASGITLKLRRKTSS